MGYACPVCEIPQADARHLANHLAFTAMLGRADHREWLDEHAPGWESEGERELAQRVESEAKAVEFPQVFEDTAGGLDGEHDHEPASERSGALFDDEGEFDDKRDLPGRGHADAAGGPATRDEETQRILEEAREMTREMLRDEEADDEDGGSGNRADGADPDDENGTDPDDENAA